METLDRKRCLVPRAIEIRHKHADLKIVDSYLLLADSHGTPLHVYESILTIVTRPAPESITFL
jgi:hypothetical protein